MSDTLTGFALLIAFWLMTRPGAGTSRLPTRAKLIKSAKPTLTLEPFPDLLAGIPDPEKIRARLSALEQEQTALRARLRVAERTTRVKDRQPKRGQDDARRPK